MKSVTIAIPNFNGFDALKLCIESIRKYTEYPHRILVYDDFSESKEDLRYLEMCERKDWIDLTRGYPRLGHGGALNLALGRIGAFGLTDLAMILDNDIQILRKGWLTEMVEQVEDDTLMVANLEGTHGGNIPWFQSWFMMLNMRLYKPVDWLAGKEGDTFLPTGARLWRKMAWRYKIKPIPACVTKKYYHFVHFSCYSTEHPTNDKAVKPYREAQAKRAREELRRVRKGG